MADYKPGQTVKITYRLEDNKDARNSLEARSQLNPKLKCPAAESLALIFWLEPAVRILVGMPERGSRGGPAACEPPFIAELRRLGHEVEEDVYAYSESASALPKRISRVMRTAQRFQKRVAARSFDLVHINTSFDTKALLRDAAIVPRLQAGNAKTFLKFHGSDADLLKTKNPALVLARRRLLSHADGIGVLSSEEQENFCGRVFRNRKFLLSRTW